MNIYTYNYSAILNIYLIPLLRVNILAMPNLQIQFSSINTVKNCGLASHNVDLNCGELRVSVTETNMIGADLKFATI